MLSHAMLAFTGAFIHAFRLDISWQRVREAYLGSRGHLGSSTVLYNLNRVSAEAMIEWLETTKLLNHVRMKAEAPLFCVCSLFFVFSLLVLLSVAE